MEIEMYSCIMIYDKSVRYNDISIIDVTTYTD